MDDQCQLDTRISDDGLTAELIVPADFDRESLNPALCDAMLMRGGVEINNDTKELIVQFIEKARQAPPGVFEDVVARGTEPTHGTDGYVEWMLDKLKKKQSEKEAAKTKPEPESGEAKDAVSFYEQSIYTVVTTGDVLGQLHQPKIGQDGRDVTGKNLAAREGKPLEFKHDESIMVGKGNKILAQADGVLDLSGKTACISDTITVDEYVDFSTGNIDFTGNILIRKGVRDCFTVQAGEDVEVQGLIEAANIIAGKDLRAMGGFAGREQATAKVGGNLIAKYLDAVTSHVRGDLIVDREIINCNTNVLGSIQSPRGAIIGGETQVAGTLEIGELGAEGLPLTKIYIGKVSHLDPLIHELNELTDQLVETRQKLLDEQDMINKTSGSRVAAGQKERLCELMYEIAEAQGHLDRCEPSVEQAKVKAEAMRSFDVRVSKRVHPNTVLICAGLSYRIKNELRGPLRITLNSKGQLMLEREGDDAAMLAKQSDLGEAA